MSVSLSIRGRPFIGTDGLALPAAIPRRMPRPERNVRPRCDFLRTFPISPGRSIDHSMDSTSPKFVGRNGRVARERPSPGTCAEGGSCAVAAAGSEDTGAQGPPRASLADPTGSFSGAGGSFTGRRASCARPPATLSSPPPPFRWCRGHGPRPVRRVWRDQVRRAEGHCPLGARPRRCWYQRG